MGSYGPRDKMMSWVEEYLDVGIQSKVENTRRAPRQVLIPFADWYDGGGRHPRNVSHDDLVRFFLKEAPFAGTCSERTFNQYWRYLRAFLMWSMKTERLKTRMALLEAIDRRAVVSRDFVKISPIKLAEMIAGCSDPRDKALLAANVYNCARGSELKHLRVKNVDLDTGTIHWWNVKKKRAVERLVVPQLDPPVREWLALYLSGTLHTRGAGSDPQEWFVFPHRTRRPLPEGRAEWTYHPISQIGDITNLVQKYTVPIMGQSRGEGGPHTLRRSGALAIELALIEDDVDAGTARAVAQAMLDHRNPEMTDHYTGNSMQKRLARQLLKDRNVLPDLTTVTQLRSVDGRHQAV